MKSNTVNNFLIYWISFFFFLQIKYCFSLYLHVPAFVSMSIVCCVWLCVKQEIQKLKNDKNNIALQRSMWLDLNTLLSVKIECHRDALEAGAGGTLSVNKGAETFTLS